jgi:hypothetical protein
MLNLTLQGQAVRSQTASDECTFIAFFVSGKENRHMAGFVTY